MEYMLGKYGINFILQYSHLITSMGNTYYLELALPHIVQYNNILFSRYTLQLYSNHNTASNLIIDPSLTYFCLQHYHNNRF